MSSRKATLTVSQLSALVKRAIKGSLPATVHVLGEMSNFKALRSGHLYFTLKDADSELACVMWRSAATKLKFEPRDGMEMVATGQIEVFERAGRYQLYTRHLEPRGVGAFELAFRQRYEKLKQEGLFDPAHKKSIPAIPAHIGIITSPTGAALRDILHTISRRFPCVTASVFPVSVQGEKAPAEIAQALEQLNRHNDELRIDVIILGRGGGSLEDLWAFNEEVVARAIYASRIPIISAVGHEVDVTISDAVADLRAATPTAAAELAVPDRMEILDDLRATAHRLHRSLAQRLRELSSRLRAVSQRQPLRSPLDFVRQRSQYLDHLEAKLVHSTSQTLHDRRRQLAKLEAPLQFIEPKYLIVSLREKVSSLAHRGQLAIDRRIRAYERRLDQWAGRMAKSSPDKRLAILNHRLTMSGRAMQACVPLLIQRSADRLATVEKQLQSVSYRRTLARGYSVTREAKTGRLLTSSTQVKPGDLVQTETIGGSFESTVCSPEPEQLGLFE